MKTINMIAETIQKGLEMIQNIVAGGNEASLIWKDAMEDARKQQAAEAVKSLKVIN
ncbi:MAG: hypothetical protein HOK08_02530 [Betaproteobacteria bacterium]|jgi:hypothetical protein|nr:hypothetical protein [Betaproteobacteria bacterium]